MRNSLLTSLVISALIAGFIFVTYDEDTLMETMYSSGFIGDSAEISEAEFQEAFSDFLAKYRKSYLNSYEFENRYMIFRENYQKISDHNLNSDHIGFTLAINEFADLRQDEFADRYLGYKAPPLSERLNKKMEGIDSLSDLNALFKTDEEEITEDFEYFNWVDQGKVHEVKNQGSCGSCWAFSAVGAIESAYAIGHDTEPLDLSEQQFVDCARPQGNKGCKGGFMNSAFEYAEETHICTETEYPYKHKDHACELEEGNIECVDKVHVTDYVQVKPNSKAALKEALKVGPVSIGVSAGNLGFQFYFGGVLRYLCGKRLDHGVLAVGYGHEKSKLLPDTDYWIVKNSWGSGWGEKGYLRIRANDKGTCGVLKEPSYPIVA